IFRINSTTNLPYRWQAFLPAISSPTTGRPGLTWGPDLTVRFCRQTDRQYSGVARLPTGFRPEDQPHRYSVKSTQPTTTPSGTLLSRLTFPTCLLRPQS